MTYQDVQAASVTSYGGWKYSSTSTDPIRLSQYDSSGIDYVDRFHIWRRAWARATMFSSSIDEMIASLWMARIVNLGSKAIPLVVDEIRDEPSYLFLALPKMVGEDPVPEALYGDVEAICRFWVDWLEQDHVERG